MSGVRVRIYRVPLLPIRDLLVQGHRLSERTVLRIVHGEKDAIRVVDVSPLPYLHSESLEDVQELAVRHFQGERDLLLPPSLRTALAALSYRGGCSEGCWENSALTALDSTIAVPDEARVIKVKIGNEDLGVARRRLEALLAIRSDREFRLDCNQALAGHSPESLGEAFAGLPIQYFEEPFASLAALKQLARILPLALDESLGRDEELDALASAWVLKPNVMGWSEFERRCRDQGAARKILSNAFESANSLQLYAHAYAGWVTNHQALGFGTAYYFAAEARDWSPRQFAGPWPKDAFVHTDQGGDLIWEN